MLFAQKKVVTVGKMSDFMKVSKPQQEVNPLVEAAEKFADFAPYISIPFLVPHLAAFQPVGGMRTVHAAAATGKVEVSNQVMNAFNPLIDLIQGLAYPVAFLSLTVAGIHWILDNKERAVSQIQGSAIGFIIVQMAPMLMKLLVQITAGF